MSSASALPAADAIRFPFVDDRLNKVTLHPRLLRTVSQLLGTDSASRVRLTQSMCLGKAGIDTAPSAGAGGGPTPGPPQ